MTVRIRYSCPHCSRRIAHHPELAGQLVICSACKGEFYEPTDPLPGKAAEKALKPMPQEPRRLRVPVEMPSKDHKHDLAVLSRSGSSDVRSIEEIVEAVLLDDEEPNTEAPAALPTSPLPASRPANPAALASTPQTPPKTSPPSNPAPLATKLPGPATKPLLPPTPSRPPGKPPMAVPTAAKPAPISDTPMFVPVPTPGQRPIDSAVPPAAKSANRPVPASGLAGATPQQMVEELRRRGLGAALLTCEMAPMRKLELTFSDNMTQDDALMLLRSYWESLRGPEEKTASRPGLLKRLWGSEEQS